MLLCNWSPELFNLGKLIKQVTISPILQPLCKLLVTMTAVNSSRILFKVLSPFVSMMGNFDHSLAFRLPCQLHYRTPPRPSCAFYPSPLENFKITNCNDSSSHLVDFSTFWCWLFLFIFYLNHTSFLQHWSMSPLSEASEMGINFPMPCVPVAF